MLAHDSEDHRAQVARFIADEAKRLLDTRLCELRLTSEIRDVRLVQLGSEVPEGPNGCAVFVSLHKGRRSSDDARPKALWIICTHEDKIMVLASGVDVWEYQRIHMASALEKVQEVLARC